MILTIGIPTYNRQKFLKRLLEQLEKELGGLEGDVEVLVSDNGSADETALVCHEMQKRLPLRYHRNGENIGFDRNVTTLIEKAEGEYLWMFGDDDIFMEGAIGRMVAFLKQQKAEPKEPLGCVLANFYEDKRLMFGIGSGEFDFHDARHLDNWLMDAIAVTGSKPGGAVYNSALAKRIVKENVKPQQDGSMKLKLQAGERVAFRWNIQVYLANECILESPRFALCRRPCMQTLGDGGYYDANMTILFLERSLQVMEDLNDFFPTLNRTAAMGLGATPYRILQFFIYIDPKLDRAAHERWYKLADGFIAFYRRCNNRWWRLFWLMRQFHSRVPFGERIFWTFYVALNRIRGRGTFAEVNQKKADTGASVSKPVAGIIR